MSMNFQQLSIQRSVKRCYNGLTNSAFTRPHHTIFINTLHVHVNEDSDENVMKVLLSAATENAGLENAGPAPLSLTPSQTAIIQLQRVENARPVAMERRSYKCSKTEMDVTEHS